MLYYEGIEGFDAPLAELAAVVETEGAANESGDRRNST